MQPTKADRVAPGLALPSQAERGHRYPIFLFFGSGEHAYNLVDMSFRCGCCSVAATIAGPAKLQRPSSIDTHRSA